MADLIYNQGQIPREQWRYGLRASSATGCGWIATYNALLLLGRKVEQEALIRYYERQLPLIHGTLGTTLLAPAVCLKQMGFTVRVTTDRRQFDDLARRAKACILYYRWHKKLRAGAHFAALHRSGGQFIGYNTYTTSTGPDPYGESLDAFLKRKHYFAPVLIAVLN